MRYYEASSVIAADAEVKVTAFEPFPAAGGDTAFHVREEYTGPLLGLIWRSMPDLGPSFDQFARGLKLRVESGG
jgi:hypothetical protein